MKASKLVFCFIAYIPFLSVAQGDIRGNVMKQKSKSLVQEDSLFWTRELQMSSNLGKDDESKCLHREPVDPEIVRAELKTFVDSLDDSDHKVRGHRKNAANQLKEWHICTIVSECLDPEFILSIGKLSSKSRGHVYKTMSKVMSQESFNMLQLQQHSNMLLGEMQDWATTCPGECRQLRDSNGLLEPIVGASLADQSILVPFLNYAQCGNLRADGNKAFWYCKDEPRMIHQADIDVTTGNYFLGDIWNEPHVHGRNSQYDYFAAYGDLEKNGGAFGLRFSGHHIDLNYHWNDNGDSMSDDMPVFLGHNPLIVPEVTPPNLREHDSRAGNTYHPLMWANMAGINQFAESVELVLEISNMLLDTAPESFVPLSNWTSTGSLGSLSLADGKSISDFDYYDLSTATDSDFQLMWNIVDYTLKFTHGYKSTKKQRDIFRAEGKAIWTTSAVPKTSLPLTEEDLRSNMNFLNLRIETEEYLFFVMVNQLYSVISENEPTNHLHSIYVLKSLMNPSHACIESSTRVEGALCHSSTKVTEFEDPSAKELISGPFKYETSMWEERNLKGNSTLGIDAFDGALKKLSQDFCGIGMTATLFNANAEQVYQNSVGSKYSSFVDDGYSTVDGFGPTEEGWTGDTTMSIYSNSKVIAAAVFLASVVDTGLGYLDEAIALTFPDHLTGADVIGRITPRMILSHSSGIDRSKFNRNDLSSPYYACLNKNSTTLSECLGSFLLTDDVSKNQPGSNTLYSNEPFDIIAELTVRKTGLSNFGDVLRKYITKPLGMNNTSYDCPVVKSTSEKPHVAWGVCSTANDMAKLVQIMSNKGMTVGGKQILSASSLTQIFTHGGGNAKNSDDWIFGGNIKLPITRCFARLYTPDERPDFGGDVATATNSIMGYGLGTMIMLGNHGKIFVHAASVGGFWLVAPGRYSLYIGWRVQGVNLYTFLSDVLNALEESSSFTVSKSNAVVDNWEEIEMCGGHDMYIDLWSKLGISSIQDIYGAEVPSCSTGRRTTAIHPHSEFYQEL